MYTYISNVNISMSIDRFVLPKPYITYHIYVFQRLSVHSSSEVEAEKAQAEKAQFGYRMNRLAIEG